MDQRIRPRKGERYAVRSPFLGLVLTSWKAPVTGGDERTLPAGLEFVVLDDPPEMATAASGRADPYKFWERQLVSPKDRRHFQYGGYYLVISFDKLAAHCERLS
jgi:hypothetical protein